LVSFFHKFKACAKEIEAANESRADSRGGALILMQAKSRERSDFGQVMFTEESANSRLFFAASAVSFVKAFEFPVLTLSALGLRAPKTSENPSCF
jgi:hypothetical protein